MNTPDIKTLKRVIIDSAKKILPQTGGREITQNRKLDGSIVTEIDANLQHHISTALSERWPHVRLLGEEMSRERQMALLHRADDALWILDPLDGTTNFTTGFPIFGVSLAYVQNGVVQLAIIYDPNRSECFSAELGQGAFLNGQRLLPSKHAFLSSCVANVDYKRLTNALAGRMVSFPPYRSQRNMGSCVLEWCWLAADRIQLYLHGGQQLWDHAAGYLILSEAGGMGTRLDGRSITCDTLSKQSAVAASNPILYQAWLRWLREQNA